MKWITAMLMIIMIFWVFNQVSAEESPEKGIIIITEVFPDPTGPDVEGEFIEIKNIGNERVNIENWSISDQDGPLDFVFPEIYLEPGERAVIYVGNGENHSVSGVHYFYMGRSSSMLNNGGDDVLLSDSNGKTVDYMAYGNGTYVDAPPSEIFQNSEIIPVRGLSIERSSDTGEWFSGMPTPGYKNPDSSAMPDIVIGSFYPNARYGDEFVEITNQGKYDVDISGFYITDGEGYLYFPKGTRIKAGSSIYITQDLDGFIGETGFPADMNYSECYTPSSYPQMANSGDEIYLCNPSGEVIFSISYGDGGDLKSAPAGYVYINRGEWILKKIGRSSFPPFEMSLNGSLTVFSSPESSFMSIKKEIDSAREEILINTYQFRNQGICQSILAAISRGVEVKVLVEGNPVGGIPDEEIAVLNALHSAGADIHLIGNNRYSFDHAKYLIIDSEDLVILSENLNEDSIPYDGHGNRGWGIVIRNKSAARYMRDIFFYDFNENFSDISNFSMTYVDVEWKPMHSNAAHGINITGEFKITIIPGPENGLEQVIDAINNAKNSIYLEQFYITYTWNIWGESVRNPLIDAILNASLRGCDVRVILDGSYYNRDGDFDNDEIVDFLNDFGEKNRVTLSARLIDLDKHGILKMHNKGMIVDGNVVMISSFNWGQNSFTNNRELAVFIENHDVASYFTSLFMEDWKSDFEDPVAIISGPDKLEVNHTYEFSSESEDNTGISSLIWSLDGVDISHNSTIYLNFTVPGTHILSLTVLDNEGNENRTSMEIYVFSTMNSSFPDDPVKSISDGQEEHGDADKNLNTIGNIHSDPDSTDSETETGESNIIYYVLTIPAIIALVSAMKISWKKEN